MTPVALDNAKLFILMAAGGLFAVTGLWLLLRPKPASGAKIELFGMKFESSSAGLLVFLIGAAFLATPLFVQERIAPAGAGQPGAVTAARPGASTNSGQFGAGAPPGPAIAAIPQRVRAEGREREPNDGYDQANHISVGDSISVHFDRRSEDWFVMPLEQGQNSLHVKLRSNSSNCLIVGMEAYTEDEQKILGDLILPPIHTVKYSEIMLTGSSFIFLRFSGHGECHFELFTSYTDLR